MRQLETNLNFISSLPDDPTVTTAALKQEFDKAGNVIKGYINDTLLDDIVDADDSTAASVLSQVDGILDEFKDDIEDDMNDFKTEVNGAISDMQGTISSMSGTVGSKTSYGDFKITTGYRSDNLPGTTASADYTLTCTINNSGYFPIAIAGFHYVKGNFDSELLRYELTTQVSGRAVVTYKLRLNNTMQTTSNTVYFNILWVKVR